MLSRLQWNGTKLDCVSDGDDDAGDDDDGDDDDGNDDDGDDDDDDGNICVCNKKLENLINTPGKLRL